MKTIVSTSEGPKADVKAAMSRPGGTVSGCGAPAALPRVVKLSAAQLDREFVINIDTIHTRAETVTEVLESILHTQPGPSIYHAVSGTLADT